MGKNVIDYIKFYGLIGCWQLFKLKIPYMCRLKGYKQYLNLFAGKNGLEIGGPTTYFHGSGPLPIYPVIASLDGVNFSQTTVWEGKLIEGKNYHFEAGKKEGQQYLREATELKSITDGKYDFVVSAHCLEHIANPIKALLEWSRVISAGGYLLLILPLKEKMFDHLRPLTTLAHMIKDYQRGVGEDDLTHLDEIISLHDLRLDPRAEPGEAFLRRCRNNSENRCLHHHVFSATNIQELIKYAGLELVRIDHLCPRDMVILATKR